MEVSPEAAALLEQHKIATTEQQNTDSAATEASNETNETANVDTDNLDDGQNQDDDDGWKDFAAQKGITGKSFDEAMDDYAAFVNGTHPSLQKKPDEQAASVEQQKDLSANEMYIPDTPFQRHISALEQNGIMTPELSAQWKSLATQVDAAYSPVIKKMNEFMQMSAQAFTQLYESVNGSQWDALPDGYKKIATRKEIDALMQRQKFPNYQAAITYYASTNKPDAVEKLLAEARESGRKEGQQRKFILSKSIQRGTGNPQPQVKLSDYMTRSGTYDLDRLGKALGGREKALEMVRKEADKERRVR